VTAVADSGPVSELIEESLAAATVAYVRQGGGEAGEEHGLTWVSTGTPLRFYNGVIRTRLDASDVDRIIDATLAQFRARGRLLAWWVMPGSRPADLAARLRARGFEPRDHDLGMAADLSGLAASDPPAGVTVERVRSTEMLEEWLRVFGEGFNVPAPRLDEYRPLPFGVPPERSVFRYYLARAGAAPAATSLLFPAPAAAVLDEIATIPSMRRRGIGAAVTLAALRDARAMGYRTAVLVASEAGARVYRRLGFVPDGERVIYAPPGVG
jgi:ribosomal protein S18 acetylase RimI-like enzyme